MSQKRSVKVGCAKFAKPTWQRPARIEIEHENSPYKNGEPQRVTTLVIDDYFTAIHLLHVAQHAVKHYRDEATKMVSAMNEALRGE